MAPGQTLQGGFASVHSADAAWGSAIAAACPRSKQNASVAMRERIRIAGT
jgi:hypothetical protein